MKNSVALEQYNNLRVEEIDKEAESPLKPCWNRNLKRLIKLSEICIVEKIKEGGGSQ